MKKLLLLTILLTGIVGLLTTGTIMAEAQNLPKMKEYRITKDDLVYLSERVLLLQELTERICLERIRKIAL